MLSCLALGAKAQICEPDTTLKTVGFKPDTLQTAKAWIPYSESITVLSIRDTTTLLGGVQVSVKIDSIKVVNVIGMPPNFTYECQNPRCLFVWFEPRCVKLSGMTGDVGIYPLKIAVIAYGKVGGSLAISQRDTITRFSIVVEGTGNSRLQEIDELSVVPNPAKNEITIYCKNQIGAEMPVLLDMTGKETGIGIAGTNGVYKADISSLTSGIYLIKTADKTIRFQKN